MSEIIGNVDLSMDLSDRFGICPYVTTQKILTGKWKLIILFFLNEQTLRFNELSKRMPGVTQATLTSHLRNLEKHGLIERRVYPEVPPRVEYLMTGLGKEFGSVLDEVRSFGQKYINSQGTIGENPF
ncbi:MAG: helix-turn-helix transcriptional regulator [Clostridiales bacterium]|jgi:DNA-binding HxlR family transcriptional regulator|nr:helix-turn-helix transcriptional regulator [Clostridiales bacterium]